MVSSAIAMKSERTLRPPAGVVDDHKGKGQGLSASQDHKAKSSERQIYCDALFFAVIIISKFYIYIVFPLLHRPLVGYSERALSGLRG